MARNDLRVIISGDATQLSRALSKADKDIGSFGKNAKSKLKGGVAAGFTAVGTGAAAGLGYAVKQAMGFEKQLSSLGSVADATGKQMGDLRKQALKAGADTAFSAKEAAVAQTELAKGGLAVKDILSGGLNSALALAAAGELELGEAAAITANSMNLFGLQGKESIKVADALATAANATTADVSEFGQALTQGGAVAKSVGYSFRDTVVALEALAASGVKGSDAGTSLKTALIQLVNPSNRQAEAAHNAGLSFKNANGEMKSLTELSAHLRDKLGDQTKAQRTATLATVAGSDGVRTLTALYDAGPAKINKYAKGLDRTGSAAEVAKRKQDNLAGAMEKLRGTIDTIAIKVGTALIPVLTRAAKAFDRFLGEMDRGEGTGGKVRRVFERLGKGIGDVATVFKTVGRAVAFGFTSMARTIGDGGSFILRVVSRILGGFSSFASAAAKIPVVGDKFKGVAKDIDAARRKLDGTARSLDRLGEKDTKVKVRIYYEQFGAGGGGGAKRPQVMGDGPGKVVRRLANRYALKNAPEATPIGLTPGSSSTSLMGANSALSPLAAIGRRMGTSVSSGLRPGSQAANGASYHGFGEALDLAGPPAAMKRTFSALKARYGPRLAELIHTPSGTGIWKGRPHTYTGAVAADHYDHVHVALDLGSPGPGIGGAAGYSQSKGNRAGDGLGRAAQAARAAGFRGNDLVTALAIAGGESGWNPTRTNLKPPDHSIGLWQINQLAHRGRFGSDAALKNPTTNARAAYALFKESGFQPWSVYTSGAYKSFIGRARAAAVGSRRGSGRGGSSTPDVPSAADRVASQEKIGQRVVNRIVAKVGGIGSAMSWATGLGDNIETLGSAYGRTERRFGQSEEDLGTVGGKAARTSELQELRRLKGVQQTMQKARLAALNQAINKLNGLIKRLQASLAKTGKGRLKGAARTRVRENIKRYEDRRIELAAEAASLGGAIADTKLDIGDIDKELAEVAATPDTAATEAAEAAAEAARNAPSTTEKLSGAIGLIDAQERAGDLTGEQARAARIATLEQALGGAFGSLTDRERLDVRGDLRAVMADNTAAIADNTSALADLQAEIKRGNDLAGSQIGIQNSQLVKALADILSGEIVGRGLQGRAQTAGAGSTVRY